MSAADAQSEVIRATPHGRLLAAALIAAALALLAAFQLFMLLSMQAAMHATPPPDALAALKFLFAGFTGMAILPAIAMIVIGRKILRSGQCPPPGAWVWRDTAVRRGRNAVLIAWMCILSGTLAAVLCAAFTAVIWITFDRVVPRHELRPGMTILQERFASKP